MVVTDGAERIDTGRKKVGAMLGDGVEVGCNSVLNPGSVIGRGSRVYPLSSVRGTVPAASIYKRSGVIAAQRRQGGRKMGGQCDPDGGPRLSGGPLFGLVLR